jgi:signal transduction histidine kinase
MEHLRLRTTLLVPLLLLSFGGTLVSLLILRTIVQQQVRASLASDLQHSVLTYRNLERQRRELLVRESALLADLPSLKALMTGDRRTIVDGGQEFWKVSGSDFFALLDRDGTLVATYNRGAALDRGMVERGLEGGVGQTDETGFLSLDGGVYEVSVQPLYFGDRQRQSRLGFVVVGEAIDARVAGQVSEAAAAEVTFTAHGRVVASTLRPELQRQLMLQAHELPGTPAVERNLRLGAEEYLAAAVPLTADGGAGAGQDRPQLIVLKSFEPASRLIGRVNEWVLTLVLLALLAGTLILFSISRTLTSPLENLVQGTRELARGNFDYKLSEDGVHEIRELSRAFERMRVELRQTQEELLDSERLATIGRMASSISHDLRHYLSAMYANAEFISDARLPQSEREDLFVEIKEAVQGMTDLLDSLLLFTQTGRALQLGEASIAGIAQRAASMVRSHPAARDVRVTVTGAAPVAAWVDASKLGRAIYNLLLNGCQAARRGTALALVTLRLDEDQESVWIRVTDTGPGVSASVRQTMFLPFVSEGKASGLGLGLTLAQQIAQEHGGGIELEARADGLTMFTILLPHTAVTATAGAEPEARELYSEALQAGIGAPTEEHRYNEAPW